MSTAREVLAAYEKNLLEMGKGEVTIVHNLPSGGTMVYVPKDADPFGLVEASVQIIAKRQEQKT